jgi:hypothetical protein
VPGNAGKIIPAKPTTTSADASTHRRIVTGTKLNIFFSLISPISLCILIRDQ